MIKTKSLCAVCYKEIPAVITIEDNVWIEKECEEHGKFKAVVEADVSWFNLCRELDCKNIYNGLLIDVTEKCNLVCKYCFHENGAKDMSMEKIVSYAKEHKALARLF